MDYIIVFKQSNSTWIIFSLSPSLLLSISLSRSPSHFLALPPLTVNAVKGVFRGEFIPL